MPSGRTNIFPKCGRGLGHVTPTIFISTVGYPSDSLAFCSVFCQDQDQDQDSRFQDQDFHVCFCPRGASRPRPWSRGLHHWVTAGCVRLCSVASNCLICVASDTL